MPGLPEARNSRVQIARADFDRLVDRPSSSACIAASSAVGCPASVFKRMGFLTGAFTMLSFRRYCLPVLPDARNSRVQIARAAFDRLADRPWSSVSIAARSGVRCTANAFKPMGFLTRVFTGSLPSPFSGPFDVYVRCGGDVKEERRFNSRATP